jgi:ADP-ribose pyrophosphatase
MTAKPQPAKRARVLESKTVFRGRVFDVRRERVAEPGGLTATREFVVHHGSVVVIPILPDGRILLVHQYRHATGQYLWELVAGRIEPGEKPLVAARRELAEETGYSARRFTKLLSFFATPGFVNERLVVYAAEGLTPGIARPDSDEQIKTKTFSIRELERMMRRGRLRDAKSIATILFYLRFRSRRRA